jgi:hypothetical protein
MVHSYIIEFEKFISKNPYSLYMIYVATFGIIINDDTCKSFHVYILSGILEEIVFRVLWFDLWKEDDTKSIFCGTVLNCIARRSPRASLWALLSGYGRRQMTINQTILARIGWDILRTSLCTPTTSSWLDFDIIKYYLNT